MLQYLKFLTQFSSIFLFCFDFQSSISLLLHLSTCGRLNIRTPLTYINDRHTRIADLSPIRPSDADLRVFRSLELSKSDMQLQELNDRFGEVNSELLICTTSLSPTNSFREFDQLKLMRLAEFYPDDFSFVERMTLEHQLGLYIDNVREVERFANLKGLSDLARVMVDTKKHLSYYLVYRLLKLALTLSVARATIERSFFFHEYCEDIYVKSNW